jgi:hypothetical protein
VSFSTSATPVFDNHLSRRTALSAAVAKSESSLTVAIGLIALTFLLTLEDPHCFGRSRDVGGYLGLQPGRRNSNLILLIDVTFSTPTPVINKRALTLRFDVSKDH